MVNTAEPGGFRSLFDGNFDRTEGSDPRELSFTNIDRNTVEHDTRRPEIHPRNTPQKYTNDIRVYEKKR